MRLFSSSLNIGIFILGAAMVFSAKAHATKNVSSPYVSKGELEIEAKTEYHIDDDNDVDGAWEQSFEVGYGITDYIGVEAGIEFADAPGEDLETKALEVEAKVQFTEKGQYFIDSGVKLEYGYNTSGEPDDIGAELLLAKAYDRFSHGMNIGIGTEVGDDSDDRGALDVSWKTEYEISETFSLGFEYYGDFGDMTDEYDDQEHLIGPVAYGDFIYGAEYEAGILFGISEASPDAALKLNFGYEF